MLPEIWLPNLKAVFVGTCVTEESDALGLYYASRNNAFWDLLEYAGLIPAKFFPKEERQTLREAHARGQLSEPLRQLYFEKKQSGLLRLGIGLTDLNRRVVVSNDQDPEAKPTEADIKEFITKVEKLKPRVLGFVMSPEVFEEAFKPLYPEATRNRGEQAFEIHGSGVWLLGSTIGLRKDARAREDVFEQFATFLSVPEGSQQSQQ